MYNKLDVDDQAKLDEARKAEFDNYKRFEAVEIISKAEADRLTAKGIETVPTQWVDTDKNSGLSTKEKPLPPKYKSRLVARGDLQKIFGRTDSPTCGNEVVFLI